MYRTNLQKTLNFKKTHNESKIGFSNLYYATHSIHCISGAHLSPFCDCLPKNGEHKGLAYFNENTLVFFPYQVVSIGAYYIQNEIACISTMHF